MSVTKRSTVGSKLIFVFAMGFAAANASCAAPADPMTNPGTDPEAGVDVEPVDDEEGITRSAGLTENTSLSTAATSVCSEGRHRITVDARTYSLFANQGPLVQLVVDERDGNRNSRTRTITFQTSASRHNLLRVTARAGYYINSVIVNVDDEWNSSNWFNATLVDENCY